jgi:two-component system, response regulator PdtaR
MPHAIVLIVADEFLIRIHAPEMIKDAGYEVVDAINADQAIAILEARRGIHIPGSMDGLKLAGAKTEIGKTSLVMG